MIPLNAIKRLPALTIIAFVFPLLASSALVADEAGSWEQAEESTYTDPSLGTYFFDAVNGDDTNDGTSPETAWQNPERLDSVILRPGDVILFKAGDVYTGRFYLFGSGTREEPIVFGAYGSGPKPKLQGGENDLEVVFITGDHGLVFRNLVISNHHPEGTIAHRFGIHLRASAGSGDMEYIHFHDLDFINIEGSDPENESRGIMAEALDFGDEPDNLRSRFNDFIIEDCYFENIDGRAVQMLDLNQTLTDSRVRSTGYYPTIGFVFQNNTGMNINRNMLQIRGTKDAVIQYNYMSGTEEGSAFWPFDTEGTLVQFNDFRHLRNPNADSYVCHFDYNCIDSVMQYNFGYDVDGGLIEIIVWSNYEFFQEDAIARYNVGVDVGFRNKTNGAGIFLTGRVTRSKVYNNTIVTTDLRSSYKSISVNNWGGEWPDNNEIYNNLFLATGNRSTTANITRLSQLGNVVSNNLYYGNIEVPSADINPITGNPFLIDPSGLDPEDFKLSAGSPAIAAGLPIEENGGRDFFGNPLLPDLTPSIGFHEYQTEGLGEWAGFDVDVDGYINAGAGFLGWLEWDRESNWLYSFSSQQFIFTLENYVTPDSGAWIYVRDQSKLSPTRVTGKWFVAEVYNTWVASYGAQTGTGPGWLYVLDLSSFQ